MNTAKLSLTATLFLSRRLPSGLFFNFMLLVQLALGLVVVIALIRLIVGIVVIFHGFRQILLDLGDAGFVLIFKNWRFQQVVYIHIIFS